MALRRLDASVHQLGAFHELAIAEPSTLVLRCLDADTVLVVADLHDDVDAPLGLWLRLDEGYSAQMAARDVKTLSWLVDLRDVVVEGDDAAQRAEVVRALLTNDRVDLVSDVAVLDGAFNRPAPPRPVTVWASESGRVFSPSSELELQRVEELEVGQLFRYSESSTSPSVTR